MTERWVITILRDDDHRRFYTGTRDENDLRVYTDTATDPLTLKYVAKECAVNDLRFLVHDTVRAWVELEKTAKHRDAVRAGIARKAAAA